MHFPNSVAIKTWQLKLTFLEADNLGNIKLSLFAVLTTSLTAVSCTLFDFVQNENYSTND